jgi:hypothetical protein
MSAFPNHTLPFASSSSFVAPQELPVNQQFYGPNYLVNGASVDSNTFSLASIQNPYLQQNPYAASTYSNPYSDLSSYGVGTDFHQASHLSRLHHNDPARLQRAKNEVPLARIGLEQFQHQLGFQDRSETRQLGFAERSDIRGLGFQDKSETRQLAFADRASVRDLGLQEKQLKLLDKKDERNFFGTLLGTIVPSVIGLISNNQQGAREERMFKFAQQNNIKDVKDDYEAKYEKKKLLDRIAQLERKLDRYKDDDYDDRKVKKTKKRKRKDDDDYGVRTVDKYGDSSWVVVKAKASAKSTSA